MIRKLPLWILTLMLSGNLIAGSVATLKEAKSLAAETNKPILIDFMTDW